jgi:hypothetical protein
VGVDNVRISVIAEVPGFFNGCRKYLLVFAQPIDEGRRTALGRADNEQKLSVAYVHWLQISMAATTVELADALRSLAG